MNFDDVSSSGDDDFSDIEELGDAEKPKSNTTTQSGPSANKLGALDSKKQATTSSDASSLSITTWPLSAKKSHRQLQNSFTQRSDRRQG